MERTLFAGGPGFFTHSSKTIQMHEDSWKLTVSDKVIERRSNLQGPLGASKDYSLGVLTFSPIATLTNLAGLLPYLFPYQPSSIGSLVFPSTDKPCVIQTKSGQSVTLAAAALTKMPSINFAPGKDLFSGAELTCLIANETDGTSDGDFVTPADSAYSEPTLDPLALISSIFAVAWGSTAPFDEIETDENGVAFEPTVELTECKTSNAGLLNYRVSDVKASAKFTPVNIDVADFFSTFFKLDGSVARGKMVGQRGQPFTVTGASEGDPILTIPNAVPVDPTDVRFGQKDSRIGEVTLMAHRKSVSGVLQALYALTQVVAP